MPMVGDFHKVGADHITSQGLGLVPRIILAVFAGLFAAVMFLTAPDDGKAIYFYLFGGLCAVIALACIFRGRVRQFFGSIVGVAVFALAIWYLWSEAKTASFVSHRPGDSSLLQAILFAFALGLPGLGYAVKTRFGFRRSGDQRQGGA
jgi:hypothetical protein